MKFTEFAPPAQGSDETARTLSAYASWLRARHVPGQPLVIPAATAADLIVTLDRAAAAEARA